MSISRPTDGMGVFCTRCNAEMEPDAGFCPNCGEPRLLNETVVLPGDPTEVVEETIIDEPAPLVVEDRPTIPPWAAALIGILATLAIVLLVVLLMGRNDDNGPATTTTVATTVVTLPPTAPPAAPANPPQVIVVPPPATSPPATSPPATSPPATAPPTTAAP